MFTHREKSFQREYDADDVNGKLTIKHLYAWLGMCDDDSLDEFSTVNPGI